MKVKIIIIVLLFSKAISAQIIVGYNLNYFDKIPAVLNMKSETNFLPIEEVLGYKFKKIPYSIKFSFTQSSFEKNANDGYYRADIPEAVSRVDIYSFPLLISKRFYLNDSILPLYFNVGFRYTGSYGVDDLKNKYFMHGPGYDLSISGEFGVSLVSVGVHETFELFGTGINRNRRAIYFSWEILLSKKMLRRKFLHKP